MIFKPVTEIKDTREKKFFIEKVLLFIKIVRAFVERNFIITDYNTEESANIIIHELINIGLINKKEELDLLKKKLKGDYTAFINSVAISLRHKSSLGVHLQHLSNAYRKKVQKERYRSTSPKLVDFFCGAGGLSLGFIQEGFEVELANDFESVCIETYKYNHPDLSSNKLIHGDIRDIVDNVNNYIDKEIDIVVGGPPCQGFSSANQQRIIDDPRNELYKYFLKGVENIAPKFVVMENVKGMLSVADQVVEDYSAIKIVRGEREFCYSVAYKLLNSENFSVAQRRERLIFIAIRNDVAKTHNITPELIFNNIESSYANNSKYNLKDALNYIRPLNAQRIKNRNEVDDDETGRKVEYNFYKGNENSYLRLINNNKQIEFTYNHKSRYCNDINFEIYRRLNQGENATSPQIADIMPYSHRNHCFKDKYFKLIADRPCRTITAHMRMDCHSHIHPEQVRSLTPREAARVQSFPDDYVFLGAYLKTYMQIGNAVPPLMSKGIAKVIKKYIS